MAKEFVFNAQTAPETYSERPGYNYLFVIHTQMFLNQRLKAGMVITTNEALRELGMNICDEEDGDSDGWGVDENDFLTFGLGYSDWSKTDLVLRPNARPLGIGL